MTNKLVFTISAVDRTTAVVNKITAGLNKATAPSRALNESIQRLSRATGLDSVARGISRVGSSALVAAKRISMLVPAVGALFGAGSIAGIAALTSNVARSAVELDNLSRKLGISVRELDRFETAGRLVGISAQTTDAALEGLGNTIEQASTGVNVEAANVMRQLGIEIKRLPNGSVDAINALKQIADKVKGLSNAQAQQTVANAFGIGSMLPMLRLGAAGIEQLERKASTFAGTLDDAAMGAGKRYNELLVEMDKTTGRFTQSLGVALLPAVIEVTQFVTKLVNQYGAVVSSGIAEYTERLAGWLQKGGWKEIADWAKDFAKSVSDAVPALKTIASTIEVAQRWITGSDSQGRPAPKWDPMHPIDSWGNVKDFYGGRDFVPGKGPNPNGRAPFMTDPSNRGLLGWLFNADDPAPKNVQAARKLFSQLERQYGLPPGSMDAQWYQESGRGTNMISPKGAQGHFQLMPGTAAELGVSDPFDLTQSATGAAKYMSQLMARYGGDYHKALIAYNWGMGNLDRKGVAAAPRESVHYAASIESSVRSNPAGASALAGAADRASGRAVSGKVDVTVNIPNLPAGGRVSTRSQGDVKAKTNVGTSTVAAGAF